jgi:energy-coupling factor transporter ATP-binding protein EcfA2
VIDLQNGNSVAEYGKYNVILGKNGSGKSTLLRLLDATLPKNGCVRYITPGRGGELRFEGNIESTRAANPTWFQDVRRNNRYDQFRQSSTNEFRNLETLVLRSIERDQNVRSSSFVFDNDIDLINSVLDRVRLTRADGAGFDIVRKSDGGRAQPNELSSGESELISLSIEILYYCYQCKLDKYNQTDNWLLFDEPDVHLHPDLQHKLMQLLVKGVDETNAKVAIATHSTSILASLTSLATDVKIGFKSFGNQALVFEPATEQLRSILPMFGAHPLSNVFNQSPPLIVEGEDDERIWQSAFRRSQGRISITPCVAGDIQSMNEYEVAADRIIKSVYDNAKAFSLRDRDDDPYEIGDVGAVVRARLNCRSAENLILSDDCLVELGTAWPTLQAEVERFIAENDSHPRHTDAVNFQSSGWDRRNFNLKNLRMLLVGLSGSTKPWEVAAGQAIARMPEKRFGGDHSIQSFLGPKIVDALDLSE